MDDGDRAWLMDHLRVVANENLQDDLDQLFSRLDTDGDGKVQGLFNLETWSGLQRTNELACVWRVR